MKTYFLKSLIILSLGLLLTSCQKDLKGVETLELSEYATVAFDQAGGQKEIAVTTNNVKWTASPNATWIKVSQGFDTFTVTAEPNPGTEARSGEVLVLSGSLSERIPVEQAAMTDEIYLSTETVSVDQNQREVAITVKSLSGEWSVEDNLPEWISYTRVPGENVLTLSIAANESLDSRTHKVFVHSKGEAKEITVTQAGKVVLLLPYLVPEATTDEVKDFEEARGSKLQVDAAYLNNGSHTYVTVSDELRVIKYTFDTNKELAQVQMNADNLETITGEPFAKFLENEGFVFWGDNTVEMVYVKKFKKQDTYYDIVCNITYSQANPNFYKKVIFNFVKGQNGDHPTYNSLPLGIGRFDVVTDQVAAWESTNGGTMNEINTEVGETFSDYFYDIFDRIYVTRRYIFNASDKLVEMDIFLYDVNKIFYSPEEGKYYVTNEFKELLTREGFTEIQRVVDNAQFDTFYRNPGRNIALAVRVGNYAEINDGVPVAHMLLVPIQ